MTQYQYPDNYSSRPLPWGQQQSATQHSDATGQTVQYPQATPYDPYAFNAQHQPQQQQQGYPPQSRSPPPLTPQSTAAATGTYDPSNSPMSRQPLLPPGETHAQYAYSTPTPAASQSYPHSGRTDDTSPTPPKLAADGRDGNGRAGGRNRHGHGIMQETEDELTEDELRQYEAGILTWDKAKNWRFWFRKEWTWYYVAFVLIIVLVALMAIFHHSIIDWLSPFVRRLQNIHYGWLIPVAILFVLSFPPLFGNEIVMILVGIVWGLGVGFAITAVGIGLGEVANYFVFRYGCRTRAHRLTRKSLNYACLTEVVRSGGFWMCFLIRLSAIPTHVSTVLFAVCELPFWQYLLALIAGLPKQLIAVYVGVVLAGSSGDTSKTSSRVISDTVFGVTAVITLGAMWYIYRRMSQVRKGVLIGMRKDLEGRGVHVQGQGQARD